MDKEQYEYGQVDPIYLTPGEDVTFQLTGRALPYDGVMSTESGIGEYLMTGSAKCWTTAALGALLRRSFGATEIDGGE